MKKILYIPILAIAFILAGCAKSDINGTSGEITEVQFKAADFTIDNETKISVTDDGKFQWAEKDTVGIYPNTGSQVVFPITSGTGETTAKFDGGGWQFKTGAKYYSYYPFNGDIYLDRHKIPVTYEGQKQTSVSGRNHIGPFMYMYSPAVSSDGGDLTFSYKHLSGLFSLRMKLAAATYTKVLIIAPSKIFVKKGYYDLQSDSPSIVPTEYTDTLKMDLDNIISTGEEFKVLIASAPVNLSEVTLTISAFNSDGEEIKCQKTLSKDYSLQAGHICQLNCSDVTWNNNISSLSVVHSETSMSVPQLGSVKGTVNWGDGSKENYSSSLVHTYSDATSKTMVLDWQDGNGFEIKEMGSISSVTISLTE